MDVHRIVLFAIAVWCAGFQPSRAQTIQLPTQSVFGVGTTVSVPDGGGTYLGGINRSMYGADTRGTPLLGKLPLVDRLFRNRAIGSNASSAGLSVHAAIHDMTELDQAVLAEAATRRSESPQTLLIARRGAYLSRTVGQYSADSVDDRGSSGASVSAIKRQNERERATENAAALGRIEQGRQALADGKPGIAKIHFQMAAKQGSGEVRSEAVEALDSLYREKLKATVAKNQEP